MDYRNFCKGLLLTAAFSSFFLTGCSVNPATGKSQFTALMPATSEASIGAEQHQEIIKQYGGLYKDQRVQSFVNDLGKKLALNTERGDVTYQFFVLDSPVINAFALPGGYIYVTRGLMAVANDEAELAGVLGHEIGHVTARHSAARYSQNILTSLGANLIGAAVGNQALTQALGVGNNLYISSYSRDQETEADALGIRYVRRANYDPQSVADFLSAMGHYQSAQSNIDNAKASQASFFSTHPATDARVSAASAEASRYEKGAIQRNKDAYLSIIDGMTFGDSLSQGVVRGNSFLHPELGFTFTVPQGFKIQNSPTQIAASHSNGSIIVVDAAASSSNDPSQFIVSDWLKGQKNVTPERLTIGGRNAATVTIQGTLNSTPVNIQLVAISWGDGKIYRMQMASPVSLDAASRNDMKQTMLGFRSMTRDEIAGIRPHVIRIVTAQVSDTVQSMGARMVLEKSGTDMFRALNNITINGQLKVGERYKIVSY